MEQVKKIVAELLANGIDSMNRRNPGDVEGNCVVLTQPKDTKKGCFFLVKNIPSGNVFTCFGNISHRNQVNRGVAHISASMDLKAKVLYLNQVSMFDVAAPAPTDSLNFIEGKEGQGARVEGVVLVDGSSIMPFKSKAGKDGYKMVVKDIISGDRYRVICYTKAFKDQAPRHMKYTISGFENQDGSIWINFTSPYKGELETETTTVEPVTESCSTQKPVEQPVTPPQSESSEQTDTPETNEGQQTLDDVFGTTAVAGG